MKETARKLRLEGNTFGEISKLLGIKTRTIRLWAGDIKLTKEQISEKIRRMKILESQERYRNIKVDEKILRETLKYNGVHRTIKLMGLTHGSIRYWCREYGIDIELAKKKNISYDKCCLCDKKYSDFQLNRPKICNTCVSKLRRRASKIKAINYLGGKCKKCNYEINDINFAAFEFHHSEDNKEMAIGTSLNRKWEIIKKELDKCELLCSNCHRIIHSDYDNTKIILLIKEKYLKDNFNLKQEIILENSKTIIGNKKEYVKIDDDKLKDMVKTESITKIATKFNISTDAVRKICENKNITIPKKHFLFVRFNVSKDDLENLITKFPMTKIGKMYGVSDNAIRKRCNKLEINWKEITKNKRDGMFK